MTSTSVGDKPKRIRSPHTAPSELDYYARMLQKIQTKKHEVYAISRILHRLDDPEVELVAQQAVHTNDGLALLDLYLPQFTVALEVDELHHIAEHSRAADKAREQRVLRLSRAVDLGSRRDSMSHCRVRVGFEVNLRANRRVPQG